ncbi:MAG: hypothetical protein GWO44_18270 [Thermoplasmata archaeon]|nr:hypothetical protein [Thermoplasmata archaeon]NIY05145.1 hypothetical protein [Thermoplasmata archaeon]
MRTTLRGLQEGTLIRYQDQLGARKEDGKVLKVHGDGTVSVVLDQRGVYLVPVTPEARDHWLTIQAKIRSVSGDRYLPRIEVRRER